MSRLSADVAIAYLDIVALGWPHAETRVSGIIGAAAVVEPARVEKTETGDEPFVSPSHSSTVNALRPCIVWAELWSRPSRDRGGAVGCGRGSDLMFPACADAALTHFLLKEIE